MVYKKFKINFKDIKLCNFGIDPDTNKIHRLDCEKRDIIFKPNPFYFFHKDFLFYILLTFLLIIFTFIWKIY